MALEREALSHNIEDDLALRNRNWDKLESHLDHFKDTQIIGIGGNSGVVIDMNLEDGFYLLMTNRDNAMYYIGVRYNEGTLSEIIPMPTGNYEITLTGRRLFVDFKTRTRGYLLLKVS